MLVLQSDTYGVLKSTCSRWVGVREQEEQELCVKVHFKYSLVRLDMGLEGTLYATMWIGFIWLMILYRLQECYEIR
jgi:hypothetical protein